jgi:branched-subunit amino acid transport protein
MTPGETDPYTLMVVLGLTAVTVVTRCFFFLSNKPWTLPNWAERGLAYAPIAALAAVIAPEVLMAQGQLIHTWQDARLYGAVAGGAYFALKRGTLGTIVCGMAVFLPLRIFLGW